MERINTVSPIYFTDYDKISDVLMHFTKDLTFRFNVRLASKGRDGSRRPVHMEVMYETEKYDDTETVVNIRRDMDFYFSIEHSSNHDYGLIINPGDAWMIKRGIDMNVFKWIGNDKVYGTSPIDGSLIVFAEPPTVNYFTSPSKYIEFMPIVWDENYGIRITVNDYDNYVDMSFVRFLTFYQILTNTDMYGTACALMNYAKTAPYGINLIDKT